MICLHRLSLDCVKHEGLQNSHNFSPVFGPLLRQHLTFTLMLFLVVFNASKSCPHHHPAPVFEHLSLPPSFPPSLSGSSSNGRSGTGSKYGDMKDAVFEYGC